MSDYTIGVTCPLPFDEALAAARDELAAVGFGILTEVDMKATFAAKIGVEIEPQVILGACNPTFAHRAVQADPSVATLLPCSVVVRHIDAGATAVEAFDPAVMARLSPAAEEIHSVAGEVRPLLQAALDRLAARGKGPGAN